MISAPGDPQQSASEKMINAFDVHLMVKFRLYQIIHMEFYVKVHLKIYIKIHKRCTCDCT